MTLSIPRETVLNNTKTLAAAAAGGALLHLTGMPAAWLGGAVIAAAAHAMTGARAEISAPLRSAAFLMIGVVIGSSADAGTFGRLHQWPVSLAVLGLTLAALLVIAPWYLMRVHKLDSGTAKLASVPGALSAVVAMSESLPVDQRRVAVLHTLRVAALMFIAPLAVFAGLDTGAGAGADANANAGANAGAGAAAHRALITWADAALIFACAAPAAALAWRVRFPAPFLSGPMFASVFLFGAGWVDGALPETAVTAAYVTLGAVVGARFAGVDRRFLASCAGAAAGGIALAVGVTALAAWPAAAHLGLPFMQLWLAFAPGGFEAMTALAVALDADPVFVAGHQFARLMALFLLTPWLFRNAGRDKDNGKDSGGPAP